MQWRTLLLEEHWSVTCTTFNSLDLVFDLAMTFVTHNPQGCSKISTDDILQFPTYQ